MMAKALLQRREIVQGGDGADTRAAQQTVKVGRMEHGRPHSSEGATQEPFVIEPIHLRRTVAAMRQKGTVPDRLGEQGSIAFSADKTYGIRLQFHQVLCEVPRIGPDTTVAMLRLQRRGVDQ